MRLYNEREMRLCVRACAPTIVAGGLLLDCGGHGPRRGLPEWVAPALGGPLARQRRVLLTEQDGIECANID